MRYEKTTDGLLAVVEEESTTYTKEEACKMLDDAELQLANHNAETAKLEAAVVAAQAIVAKCTELNVV